MVLVVDVNETGCPRVLLAETLLTVTSLWPAVIVSNTRVTMFPEP